MSVSKLVQNAKVSVIGAGISGLSFSYFLGKLRPDVKITIFEKQTRVGGYINTAQANEETIKRTKLKSGRALKMEKGPRTLRGVSPGTLIIVDLLEKMGLLNELRGVHVRSEANKKYLKIEGHNGGELLEVPGPGCSISTMTSFFTSPLGRILIFSILRNLAFKPDGKQLDKMSVEEFLDRQFGKEFSSNILSALMYGIYAADVSDLNVSCVLPALVNMEKESGSVIKSMFKRLKYPKKTGIDHDVKEYIDNFGTKLNLEKMAAFLKKFPMLALTNGLSVLTDGLKDNMPPNVEIITGSGVQRIKEQDGKMIVVADKEYQFDHVRSTIDATSLGQMVEDKSSALLNQFQYTSVIVTNVLIPQAEAKNVKGFGFLVPKAQLNPQTRVMGVIFDSDVEEHSSPLFQGSIP
ncbi:unnamed protein product [Pichia kudriavzevii]